MNNENTTVIAVRVPLALHRVIARDAARKGLQISVLIRMYLMTLYPHPQEPTK